MQGTRGARGLGGVSRSRLGEERWWVEGKVEGAATGSASGAVSESAHPTCKTTSRGPASASPHFYNCTALHACVGTHALEEQHS